MNAITVQHLTAASIFDGPEPVRYPAWQTTHRGPLLIHIAKRETRKAECEPPPGSVVNAIIGVVDLSECVQEGQPGTDPDEAVYFWVLINPRVFINPIKANGKVGLFQVADKVVAEELARAATPRKRRRAVRVGE